MRRGTARGQREGTASARPRGDRPWPQGAQHDIGHIPERLPARPEVAG